MSSNGENYTFLIEGRITQFAALLLLSFLQIVSSTLRFPTSDKN